MADGGHLEFWCLDLSKYRNDARNGFPMLHLVGKVVLHGFLCRFVFKLLFQYGRRRPFWILASHEFRRHFCEGHGSSFFSKYFKELKSTVKPYYALGGHGTPRLHPTNMSFVIFKSIQYVKSWCPRQSCFAMNGACWTATLLCSSSSLWWGARSSWSPATIVHVNRFREETDPSCPDFPW